MFQLGFRPFYALASIFAIVVVIVWLSAFAGFTNTGVYLHSVVWHSHEMVFGFIVAVVSGFLLTAVQNWTGQPTPSGAGLAALAALWLAARVLIVTGPVPLAVIADVSFLAALTLAIAFPILRSKNRRNYKVLILLAALAVSHAVFHLASLGYVQPYLSRISLFVSIDLIVILMAVVGGRVIPAFTRNAIQEATSRSEPWVEILTFTSMLLVVAATAVSGIWTPPPIVILSLFVTVAAAQALRLALWEPGKTLSKPLLWMMPAAYSWIPFAFVLRALAVENIVPASAWIHAITMGAVSGFMLAMMMRSSLGHTGRRLIASRSDMAVFVLVQVAALVRLFASTLVTETYRYWVFATGLIWVLAFLLFAVRYLPMLSRPKLKN
jgi:uncharacterized protein involved in response to NO